MFEEGYLEFRVSIKHDVFNGALDIFSPASQPRHGVVTSNFLPAVTSRRDGDPGFAARKRRYVIKCITVVHELGACSPGFCSATAGAWIIGEEKWTEATLRGCNLFRENKQYIFIIPHLFN